MDFWNAIALFVLKIQELPILLVQFVDKYDNNQNNSTEVALLSTWDRLYGGIRLTPRLNSRTWIGIGLDHSNNPNSTQVDACIEICLHGVPETVIDK